MKFTIERKHLLKPLKQVSSSLGSRPTLPILGNLLLQVIENCLLLTGADLEMEIIARIPLGKAHELGAITVPARKFFDICRCLPEEAVLFVTLEDERMLICSRNSRYSLATLPASDFPTLNNWSSEVAFGLSQSVLKRLIESTYFSMAQQDVRYYLNGMLFETEDQDFRTVTTDGHRLSICTISVGEKLPSRSVIVPRKGVMELVRMLDGSENFAKMHIGSNNIRVSIGDYMFAAKLIDGRFPDYRRVLLKNPDKILQVGRNSLKQAFVRAAIISNSKFCSVQLYFSANQLKITAKNAEKEEAEEILEVSYCGIDMEIAFNSGYVLDVLNTLKCEKVRLLLTDAASSVQITDSTNQEAVYVIMPIRL